MYEINSEREKCVERRCVAAAQSSNVWANGVEFDTP